MAQKPVAIIVQRLIHDDIDERLKNLAHDGPRRQRQLTHQVTTTKHEILCAQRCSGSKKPVRPLAQAFDLRDFFRCVDTLAVKIRDRQTKQILQERHANPSDPPPNVTIRPSIVVSNDVMPHQSRDVRTFVIREPQAR